VSPDGKAVSLVSRVACAPILPAAPGKLDDASVEGLANLPYAIPNIAVEGHNPQLGVPTGFWRSVGSSQNAFFSECFIDEMAVAAGKDPFEFRVKTEKSPGTSESELAAKKGGRPCAANPRDCGGGVVRQLHGGSAEVSWRTGAAGIAWLPRSTGPIVNPDIIAAQIESAIVYGLTAVATTIGAARSGQFRPTGCSG
jgi:CO/xanthine dehydrogenase Mo-binding subunit